MPIQTIQPGQVPVGVLPFTSCFVAHSLNGFAVGATLGSVYNCPAGVVLWNGDAASAAAMAAMGGGRAAAALVSGAQLGLFYGGVNCSRLAMEKIRNKNDSANVLPGAAAVGWVIFRTADGGEGESAAKGRPGSSQEKKKSGGAASKAPAKAPAAAKAQKFKPAGRSRRRFSSLSSSFPSPLPARARPFAAAGAAAALAAAASLPSGW